MLASLFILPVSFALNTDVPHLLQDNADWQPGTRECRQQLYGAASDFADTLREYSLNVVTAESLTAGMISSHLVDVPGRGSYIYGGHAVYDADAKRVFLGVREPNVYTEACARQMARGAIDSSRALVGISVTGEAGPIPYPHTERLGVVDFAVSLKTTGQAQTIARRLSAHADAYTNSDDSGTYATMHKRFHFCGEDGHPATLALCQQYFDEAAADAPRGWVAQDTLADIRLAIRQETVYAALRLSNEFLSQVCAGGCPALVGVKETAYDGDYLECGEPSWIVNENRENPLEFPTSYDSHCDAASIPYKQPWDCPAEECAPAFVQCGGQDYYGPNCCAAEGQQCFKKDNFYAQCLTSCPSGWECENNTLLGATNGSGKDGSKNRVFPSKAPKRNGNKGKKGRN